MKGKHSERERFASRMLILYVGTIRDREDHDCFTIGRVVFENFQIQHEKENTKGQSSCSYPSSTSYVEGFSLDGPLWTIHNILFRLFKII